MVQCALEFQTNSVKALSPNCVGHNSAVEICQNENVNNSLDNVNMYQNSIGRRFFVTCIASYKSHDGLPLFHTSNANFYTVLEIEKDASSAQVKNAYFEKSKELHPDKNDTEEAKQNYKDVREAYDILGDKRKRRVYDKLLFKQEYRENLVNDYDEKQSNFKGKD